MLENGNNNVGVEWNIIEGIQQSGLIYKKNSYRLQLLAQIDFSWFERKDGTWLICKLSSYSIILSGVEWFLWISRQNSKLTNGIRLTRGSCTN